MPLSHPARYRNRRLLAGLTGAGSPLPDALPGSRAVRHRENPLGVRR